MGELNSRRGLRASESCISVRRVVRFDHDGFSDEDEQEGQLALIPKVVIRVFIRLK
jgi:hypothetical protein